MRRTILGMVGTAALVATLAGCSEEDPTEVGVGIIGEEVRTYQVTLDAADFLESDTTFDNIGSLNDAQFGLVADSFAGELTAHSLFRVRRPFTVTWQDDGSTRTDSLAAIRGGTLIVALDTLADNTTPVTVEVLPLTESWDEATVTWDLRYDTAGTAVAWTQPGGTTGAVMASATWTSGDTLRIPIDSAAAAVWQDTTAAQRGGQLRLATPGGRLRIRSVEFDFDVVPVDADTTLTAGAATGLSVIATPDSPAPGAEELRVGGLPAWRSLLRFRSLAAIRIPCDEAGTPGCTIGLDRVTINLASLLLEPLQVNGHRIEGAMRLEGRAVLPGPGVPLTRSALSAPLGTMRDVVEPAAFSASPPDPTTVAVPVTGYVERNLNPDLVELDWLALTAFGERSLFGYAAFGSLESATPPRLRLIVSAAVRELNP